MAQPIIIKFVAGIHTKVQNTLLAKEIPFCSKQDGKRPPSWIF